MLTPFAPDTAPEVLDGRVLNGDFQKIAPQLPRAFVDLLVLDPPYNLNSEYCCWALKRLATAETDKTIQGYANGVFWERNSLNGQKSDAVIGAKNPFEFSACRVE